ncbi:cation channel family transporter (macronuclear) [Tetrahymena thermophila SB210]|uniref:Cation channel family transporter n=1 Tax=Tetrahymena thermophila (strain SB210) TaxID=312017 RepID=Q22XZ8_TETTS|nr:cation channel family transporter [Tetrahymena thermophila SB210]EAR90226.2 cation channel family transporter [Tetrahymena thermophila SB210]|eukprot:XP_001010471.2 cation channel family transporter [Tetrahymena thermophila SB210]
MNTYVEQYTDTVNYRRGGLFKYPTKGSATLRTQYSLQTRKKKGLIPKKIPEKFTQREYDNNELSSKWDVKNKALLEYTSINEERHYAVGEERKMVDKSTFQGLNSFQMKSLFFQKDEDLEEDNSKKMVQFFYHGKTFTYCKESCQLFKKEHLIRRLSVWITEWNYYKFFTFITILTMAVFMGMHNYNLSDEENIKQGGYQSIFSYTKYFYISYFAIEIVLKIIARGLYQSYNSYLKNINNLIILIVFGIIVIYDTSFIFLFIFRIFYVFEFTSNIKQLRKSYIILKLYQISGETLFKLLFLIFFFITLFGILSTNIFSGSLDYRCRTTPVPGQGDWELAQGVYRVCGGRFSCPDNTYCGSNYSYIKNDTSYIDSANMDKPTSSRYYNYGITNFDNLYQTYLTLFLFYMVEGYYNVLYMMEDSHDQFIPIIFVTCYFLVCTYFLNNLIIAIFFIKYQQIESEEEKKNASQKRKSNSVRFQGSQQHQQYDAITNNQSLATNSFYNLKGGAADSSNKNVNRIYPEKITLNTEKQIQNTFIGLNLNSKQQIINPPYKRRNAKQLEELNREKNYGQSIELKQNKQIDQLNNSNNSNNKKDLKKHLEYSKKVSLKSIAEEKDIFYMKDRNVAEELKKFKQLYASEFLDKSISRAETNKNKNNGQQHNNFSLAYRTNASFNSNRRKTFNKIPFSPSIYGQSILNLLQIKSSKNKIESQQKENELDYNRGIIDIFLSNKIFLVFINLCIFCNIIVLSFNQYPAVSDSFYSILKTLNLVFILLFLFEDALRLLSSKQNYYILLGEIIIDVTSTVIVFKTKDLVPFSCLKGIRILYAFTNIQKWVNYRILIDAMNHSMSYVINIMLIAFSFMYLGTIIGMWLFGGKLKFNDSDEYDLVNGKSPRFNFDNILSAFTLVFTTIQGDQWNRVWFDCVRSEGSLKAHPYFILLMVIGKTIFLNSFTAIMLASFDYANKKSDAAMRGAKTAIDQILSMKLRRKNSELPQEMQKKDFIKNDTYKNINSKFVSKGDDDSQSKEDNFKSSVVDSEKQDDKFSLKAQQKKRKVLQQDNNENRLQTEDNQLQTLGPLINNQDQQTLKDFRSPGLNFKIMPLKNDEIDEQKPRNANYPKPQKVNEVTSQLGEERTFQRQGSNNNDSTPDQRKSPFQLSMSSFKQYNKHRSQADLEKEKKKLGKIGFYLKYSSCFMFHKNSFIRKNCIRLIETNYWDNFFLVHIVFSSIQLALDNPLYDPNSIFKQVLQILNFYFTVVFCVEAAIKIIAYGFLYNFTKPDQAYLRSPWNILDFFVNICAIVDLSGFLSTQSLKSLKSLRVFRALRPLKIITKNESLKLLVNSLFQTIPVLTSLAFVILIMTWIFAIFLMSSFKGELQYCSFDDINNMVDSDLYKKIVTIQDCNQSGGQWVNQYFNFDTVFLSVISLFKIILGENWTQLMWSSIDASGIEKQPIKDYQRGYALIYLLLLFMGNIFTTNLITGLVVNNFKRIKDEISGYKNLTSIQRQWVEMQKYMMKRKLKVVIPTPENTYRHFCYILAKSSKFEKIIIFFIILNLVTMGCQYKGMDDQGAYAINVINNFCLGIYHVEALIKIVGVGVYFYFKDDWNKFDFGVILITDIVLFSSIFVSTSTVSNLPIIFRALRLGRIVKYIRASQSLKVLIDSIYYLLPSLINIAFLVFLIAFICAILGMNLFSQVQLLDGDQQYPFFDSRAPYPYSYNFQTFTGSFLVILQCIQNQNWDWYIQQYGFDQSGCYSQSYSDQQQDGIKGCSNPLSYPFFLVVVFFLRYIIINLFLALVIEGFFDTLKENEAVISPEVLESIIEKWSVYDQNGTGFIDPEEMYLLLLDIPEPIGLKNEFLQTQITGHGYSQKRDIKDRKSKLQLFSKRKIFQELINFNVRLYSNDKTHFMDFCVKISRNAIMKKAKDNNISDPFLINSRIVIEDSLVQTLMKNWETEYPTLKKYNKRKDEFNQPKKYFTILNYYAAVTIQDYIRQVQREKKIKEQIIKNKLSSKMNKTENINTYSLTNNQKQKVLQRNYTNKPWSSNNKK